MMVIGVFDFIFNVHFITQILASGIVIGVCYASLWLARYLMKLLKLEKIGYPLFGFRQKKSIKESK